MARELAAVKRLAPPGTRFGIQLAHAGRKASAQRPWEGGKPLGPNEDPWPTVAPSAIPFGENWHTPAEMTEADMARVRDAFINSIKRALRIGFDAIELHMAHGYLFHSFMSALGLGQNTPPCWLRSLARSSTTAFAFMFLFRPS